MPACPLVLLSPSCFMMAPIVEKKLCVNGKVVPVTLKTMSFVDPYKLAEDDPEEDLPVALVDLQANKPSRWLEAPLDLPRNWWRLHCGEVPLRKKILQLIKAKKPQKGRQLLMPKNSKSLVPLKIRGRTLWFLNNSRCVKLALRQNHEEDELLWFLQELKNDIVALRDPAAHESSDAPDDLVDITDSEEDTESDPDTFDWKEWTMDLVRETKNKLKEHAHCANVVFLKSRHSFRICRQDKVVKEVKVYKMKKTLTQAMKIDNLQYLEQAFDLALSHGEEFLNYSA